jgi:hypothetical protein
MQIAVGRALKNPRADAILATLMGDTARPLFELI